MIRKISAKIPQAQDRLKKPEAKNDNNEYYLPYPQIRAVKTPSKEISLQQSKDKNIVKLARKTSQCASVRKFSITNFKIDVENLSKEQNSTPQNKHNLGKKVQKRKLRSTSNSQTPKRSISKSGLKLLLNSPKKEGISKKLNLKIETPSQKKNDKANLEQAHFDSYYNNETPNLQSKTIRVQRRMDSKRSQSPFTQFGQVFGRCKKLIQDYQEKLQSAKKENKVLKQQNERLKQEKDLMKRESKDLNRKD